MLCVCRDDRCVAFVSEEGERCDVMRAKRTFLRSAKALFKVFALLAHSSCSQLPGVVRSSFLAGLNTERSNLIRIDGYFCCFADVIVAFFRLRVSTHPSHSSETSLGSSLSFSHFPTGNAHSNEHLAAHLLFASSCRRLRSQRSFDGAQLKRDCLISRQTSRRARYIMLFITFNSSNATLALKNIRDVP